MRPQHRITTAAGVPMRLRRHRLFGSSATVGFLPPPSFPNLFPSNVPTSAVAFPSVFVFDRNFQNPRTLSATLMYERQVAGDLGFMLSYTHANTEHLTRFIDRNAAVFGTPFGTGPRALGTLTTVESSAKSKQRHHGWHQARARPEFPVPGELHAVVGQIGRRQRA
jgi:hypothetical protein